MAVLFSPWGNSQFLTSNGAPANGWKIYTYVAGSSTPLVTYTDSTGSVAQSNPIIINSLGFPTNGQIWLTSGLMYKLVFTDSSDVVQKTEDNISGVLSSSSSSLSQWAASGLLPTFVSATSFTLAGDQTTAFEAGRKIQTQNTSGTITSRILTSVFTTLTTVTVVNDTGVLDSGLSSVNYSLLTARNTSTPGAASPIMPRIDVASVAGTVDLTGNAPTDDIRLTGSLAITGFTVAIGRVLNVTAGGAFTLTNNGNIITQTGANIVCNAGDTFMLRALSANVVEVLYYARALAGFHGMLFGCIMSTAGSSTTMSVTAGTVQDSTGLQAMSLSTISKTTAAWAVGTAAGGLDTGTIANNQSYHFYVIRRPDTGVVDVLCSLSATAPTLPANYTQFRRIGSDKTNGSGQWVRFIQNGDDFDLFTPILDVSLTNPGITAVTNTLASIPTGIVVKAKINGGINNSSASNLTYCYFSALDTSDLDPSPTLAPLAHQNYAISTAGGSEVAYSTQMIKTNTSAQIRSRIGASSASIALRIATLGWVDTRGRFE